MLAAALSAIHQRDDPANTPNTSVRTQYLSDAILTRPKLAMIALNARINIGLTRVRMRADI